MNLETYTGEHVDAFLLNYRLLLQDLAEVVTVWATLDRESQSDQRIFFMQAWGNRKVLGALYQAQRLTAKQERLLAELDRQLLNQAPFVHQAYGLDFAQLLTIFRWGTPLTTSTEAVPIALAPAALQQLATALVPAAG